MEKLEQIKQMMTLINDGLTRKDFEEAFSTLIEFLKKVQENLNQRIEKKSVLSEQKLSISANRLQQSITEIEKKLAGPNQIYQNIIEKITSNNTATLEKIKESTATTIRKVTDKLSELNNYRPPEPQLLATMAFKIMERELPYLKTQIRDALEALKDNERLNIDSIDELRDELDTLRKEIKKKNNVVFVGGTGGGGRIVKSYDLSSSLNGVLKTFSLPAMWRVISVHLSSFPNALREAIDYTWTPTSITFTSEIAADSSLAEGQTCIVVYSE